MLYGSTILHFPFEAFSISIYIYGTHGITVSFDLGH
jgi:hypothetical protein